MAEKYAELRAALDAGPTEGPWHSYKKCVFLRDEGGFSMAECPRPAENADYIAAANPETVRSLLAERDALREALEAMMEYAGQPMSHPAALLARAALAQEQGGSDDNKF